MNVIIKDIVARMVDVLAIQVIERVIVRKVIFILFILIGICPSASVNGNTIECGGHGKCDETKGVCNCFAGFSGATCNRMWCPNNCNNHGRCVNKQHTTYDIDLKTYKYKAEKVDPTNFNEMEYVCVCDQEYRGGDCSESI